MSDSMSSTTLSVLIKILRVYQALDPIKREMMTIFHQEEAGCM